MRHWLRAVVVGALLLVTPAGIAQVLEPLPGRPHPPRVTLVVCPTSFQQALSRWIVYREQQGHRIQVVTPPATAAELKALIRRHAAEHDLRSLLLVGDAGTGPQAVPVDIRPARVNVFFGSEPEIATDNTFADLDDDDIPDLAVGRLPADSSEELSRWIDRIIAYELSDDFSEWRRRINVVAGVGGFDPVIDKVIEQATSRLINQHIPQGYPFSMTYGSWSSPYCPAPEKFSQTAIEKFNEGCLFWVYVGHGSRHRLDAVYTPKGRYDILTERNIHELKCEAGHPIALMLCCYSGAFDDPRDCLAENMMRQPQGPIAVICGSRVTMPYGMSLLSLELMSEQFSGDAENLGQLFLRAKQRLAAAPADDQATREMREEIEKIASLFNPKPELARAEVIEHLALFHLLGDPLLRLAHPQTMTLQVQSQDPLSRRVDISGWLPFSGELTLEICYSRDRFRSRPLFRSEGRLTRNSNEPLQEDYLKHQNSVCTRQVLTAQAGTFQTTLELPENCSGNLTVRGFLKSADRHAIGADALIWR